ncbi:DNA-binding protein P3A2 [Lamellibrachia satsuma]|nr:DNA-binding protein P3A2 [Lamellibrachia satsuma]
MMHSMNGAMNSGMNSTIMSDAISEPSSPESAFDDSDLLNSSVTDDVTSQLLAAGPIGVAAAAAIATGKKRKRPHSFETNPSIRKRQQTRLMRKLKSTIDEYITRVGQQAIVLCCLPGKSNQSTSSYKVFGSQPLETVIRSSKEHIMRELEKTLQQQAPPTHIDNTLHELPPLVIDGIPTPVDKMTQAQLRAFIPEMLKYSTSRSKPGWGKPECRPIWWPEDVPWANVRSDVRTEEQKKKVSWTHALRTIVLDCYKHHGRDDLLPEFHDSDQGQQPHAATCVPFPHHTMVQTINNPDGTVSIIQIDTGETGAPQMVTLADGTQAQIVHTVQNIGVPPHESSQAVQTLAEVVSSQSDVGQPGAVGVEMTNAHPQPVTTLAEVNPEGQLILTDASGLGMVTIPVSMYQTVVSNVNQLQNIQVAMATSVQQQAQQNGDVPDATHAVEIMTVEPSVVT